MVYDMNYMVVKTVKAPKQITGCEYEMYSCLNAIEEGKKEYWGESLKESSFQIFD